MKKNTINIAHLYPDLMNLYGEFGNIEALKKFIERQGLEAKVDKLSIKDEIDFSKYDIFYMGMGIEENEYLVLSDLYKYKDDIKKAVEDNKVFIITGNALELFGTKKRLKNARPVACLNLFEFNSVEEDKRIVSEITQIFSELEEGKGQTIIGFKNCNINIVNNEHMLFDYMDSYRYKNFFGTTMVGPLLIRNPYFTDYILNELFKTLDLEYKPVTDGIEYRAYHEYIKNFVEKN